MNVVKEGKNNPEVQKQIEARVATMSFPLDDDLPDRKVMVYFLKPNRH